MALKKKQKQTVIIGWKETVNLPDWGLRNVLAKADTGARRSALDVKNIKELPGNKVQFDVVLHGKDRDFTHTVVSDIAHQTHVRSSNGQVHERYFVKTRVSIDGHAKEVEFSLVCRKSMTCRILLGRKAMEGQFLVDSSRKYLTGKRYKPSISKEDERD